MRVVIIACLFLFVSCKGESVPKDVFSKQKMGDVMYAILLADEWVDYTRMYDSTYMNFSKRAAIYDSVFQLHGISKQDYQKSMAYYQGRPDVLKDILEELSKRGDTTSVRKIKPLSTNAR